MSLKGTVTTADYIEFDTALRKSRKLLEDDKTINIGLYIAVSIYTGLRASDVLSLKWEQLRNNTLEITEQKTGKTRIISLEHPELKKIIIESDKGRSGFVFISQKNEVFRIQSVNRRLQSIFNDEIEQGHNISTHSLRKSFGRQVFKKNKESEKSLVYLTELFNHTSPSITRKYLGLRQEELNNVYLSL